MSRPRIYLNDLGIVCALGGGKAEVATRLLAGDASGMVLTDAYSLGKMLTLGMVRSALPALPTATPAHQSRNNRLLFAAYEEIRTTVEALRARIPSGRLGVVIGTSTSGIAESEQAIQHLQRCGCLPAGFHYGQQELGNPAQFLADVLALDGPAYSVSTACSAGAKALASAARLVRMGACDAVLAGGADALCRFTVAGFSALEAVSDARSNPCSANRRGINIGEGAALFIVGREPAEITLLGVGESSDGYHISAPDPGGKGVLLAMRVALQEAGLRAEDIDYLNLHGTATPQNDAMEARVVHGLFGGELPVSSTKPLTGHTLGAAGAIEAGLCWLLLSAYNPHRILPPHCWDGVEDPALPRLHLVRPGERARRLNHVLSNSFAFGGSNAVVLLGRG